MKNLISGVVCVLLIFAGYWVAVGTGSFARDSEALHASANSAGPTTGISAAPFDQSEEDLSAADTEVLLVGTLIALAIVAEVLPLPNDCAASGNVAAPDDHHRSPPHRSRAPC